MYPRRKLLWDLLKRGAKGLNPSCVLGAYPKFVILTCTYGKYSTVKSRANDHALFKKKKKKIRIVKPTMQVDVPRKR